MSSECSEDGKPIERGLILTLWIRGLLDEIKKEKMRIEYLDAVEKQIFADNDRRVKLFLFEGGAGGFSKDVKGKEIVSFANDIALSIEQISGENYFYNTCSFWVGVHESLISHDIRSARNVVDNHNEASGVMFIDGRMHALQRHDL